MLGLLCGQANAGSVNQVYGSNVDATGSPTSVPLTIAFLCDGTGVILDCPQYATPDWLDTTGMIFYGISNRTNPPRCVKSTDGGSVWGLCNAGTVSPFIGAITNANSGFAMASDGSLISSAIQGANTCIIRRSTNQGASWSTVFMDTTALEVCVFGLASPAQNGVHCSQFNNYCAIAGFTQGSFTSRMYYSIDNGITWTKGVGFTLVSGDQNNGFTINSNGNAGSWSMFGQTYNLANWRFAYTLGGDWTFTGVIPQPGLGTSLRCPATLFFNGDQAVLCGPDNGAADNTKYRLFTHEAGSIFLFASVIPNSGGLTNAQAPDFMAVGYNATTAYMVGRNAASTTVNGWVTRDSFSTMQLITSLTPTTALIGGCCRGDIFVWNGKVYFTSGAAGSNAFFGIIQ